MDIYRELLRRVDHGQSVALLLVVGTVGSTPQSAGAKALVDQQGVLLAGTVGGGLMEARMAEEGSCALRERAPRLVAFPMDDVYGREAGPICGGTMRILVLPCASETCESYRRASGAVTSRQRGLLMTTLSDPYVGQCRWAPAEDLPDASQPLLALLRNGTHDTLRDPSTGADMFVEVVAPVPRMLVVGGGHVGQAVVRRAAQLGFEVTVLDDRAEQADGARFPEGVHAVCGAIGTEVDRFPKERDTYIILVSKGHKPDAEALEKCIHSDVAYLGMIGSRRKMVLLRDDFLASGLATADEFDRVFAPIGLDIGAVTVDEIATSIMAQVVAVRRGAMLGRVHAR